MTIKGLTDKSDRSDKSILGRIEIKVFKGDRMTGDRNKSNTRAGRTLQENYRITTSNTRLRKMLEAAYGGSNAQGDIITDFINIYLPFDEPERTFATNMKAFSSSGLEVVCDRETITQQCQPYKDTKNNIHRPILPCNKPCEVANTPIGVECPLGCKAGGEFYFYIRELFDAEIMTPCSMTVHSYADIGYIGTRLEQCKEEISSITNSPFPSFMTKHKIPFVLTRARIDIKRPILEQGARTGKKAHGETWAVELNPSPDYMELLRAWRLAEELKRLSVAIPPRAIAGLLQGDVSAMRYIDVNAIETQTAPALPPAIITTQAETEPDNNRTITGLEWKEALRILEINNWTKEMIISVLNHKYQIQRAGELTCKQLLDLQALAVDPDEFNYWRGQSF